MERIKKALWELAGDVNAMARSEFTPVPKFLVAIVGGDGEYDPSDTAAIRTIRAHMHDIESAFRQGNFAAPGLVHAQDVPGTRVMAERRDAITYTASDRPRGAELRIRTSDATAIAAIHQFLGFQRSDHRAAGHDAHKP